ncbi:MAG: alr0857 family protein [Cyanobacteria bacterium J06633_8]
MLKITYTDNNLSLDYLDGYLEDWINTRVTICVRSATGIHIKSSTASFLLPANSFTTAELENIQEENVVEFCRCDAESLEVVLKGIWLTSEIESETGVFVTELEDKTEYLLQNMFKPKFCPV